MCSTSITDSIIAGYSPWPNNINAHDSFNNAKLVSNLSIKTQLIAPSELKLWSSIDLIVRRYINGQYKLTLRYDFNLGRLRGYSFPQAAENYFFDILFSVRIKVKVQSINEVKELVANEKMLGKGILRLYFGTFMALICN